ncbi:MAG TPA: hypothetical protein VLW49_00770 [Gaiellaceae bacterium]|nr:hypothetical protein [Gaiellaceae bacterium]
MEDLWTFPAGMLSHSDSVKGYRVDGSDGRVGKVAWADYKPDDSYLIVDVGHGRHPSSRPGRSQPSTTTRGR